MSDYHAERDMIETPIGIGDHVDWSDSLNSAILHFTPGPWRFYKDGVEITKQEYLEAVRDA